MHLSWSSVPGYNILGKALIEEMSSKSRQVRFYSSSLIDSTLAFLSNNKLLMCFVRVTFLKTAIGSVPTVMKAFEFTARWFTEIYATNNILPANFDFSFFKAGLSAVFASGHGAATAKVFWLLYQIWHVLSVEHKEDLLQMILDPARFYSFMFNWCWDTRMCFYYFFYF